MKSDSPGTIHRLDHEPPPAVAQWGWRYHHLGIPVEQPVPGEYHLPHLGISVEGFETSPFGIQWMRFDEGAPYPEIIRKIPHVAFEVDDIDEALKGMEVLLAPGSPSDGVRSAMILHNGAPVELIEFTKKNA